MQRTVVSIAMGTHLHATGWRRQRGMTLIESLVALVVLALGVLGLIGFQMRTLKDSRDGVGRSRAIVAVQDIAERIRTNPELVAVTLAANYTAAFGALAAPAQNCTNTACTPAQLAAYDLWRWKANISAALPGGQGAVIPSAGDPRQFAVMVAWRENQLDAAAAAAENRNTQTQNFAVAGTTGLGCPANFTCHLVYVQPFR